MTAQNLWEVRHVPQWIREVGDLLGGEDFFAFTFLPSLYLELGVANPYYDSVLYTGSHPLEHFQRNVAILAERRPRFILLDYSTVRKYGHTTDNPVDEFIRRYYTRAHTLPHSGGALEIWERIPDG
jgi:hypothetical protein